jgi:FkbM family methyltransferase
VLMPGNLHMIMSQSSFTLRLYDAARHAWSYVGNRRALHTRRKLHAWYSPFVSPQGLVFDVGANRGDHTACFVALGAHVVAVEPNPACARQLTKRFRAKHVTVEEAAVGAESGVAELHISENDTLSTVSEEWLARCRIQGRFKDTHWDETTPVRVTTLDHLIDQYGRPDFVKIDVEGAEALVFRGLSSLPHWLCFEFNSEAISVAEQCIHRVVELGADRLCLRHAAGDVVGPKRWYNADQIIAQLRATEDRQCPHFGDVFVTSEAVLSKRSPG